jgi:hypothetical protein
MLYVFDLQIEQTTKTTRTFEAEISGSMQEVSSIDSHKITFNQTKIVEAADETAAREKIETYYTAQNTDSVTYNVIIVSVSDIIS